MGVQTEHLLPMSPVYTRAQRRGRKAPGPREKKGKGVGVILRYSSLAKIDTDPFSAGSGELAIDASAQGALKMYNWWDEE
jgi:hypothetical protein